MATKGKREPQKHLQTWGNLALADESVGAPQYPKVRNLALVPVAGKDVSDEESGMDSLSAARGLSLGFGLSLVLWGAIILILSRIL